MKSCLAQTFSDLAKDECTRDRLFPNRNTVRHIVDQDGNPVEKDLVLVVEPYDERPGPSPRTSTLLINHDLASEYDQLQHATNDAQDKLLLALKTQSQSRLAIAREISLALTDEPDNLLVALGRLENEIKELKETPLANVPYDLFFNEQALRLLSNPDTLSAIQKFRDIYNSLLAQST